MTDESPAMRPRIEEVIEKFDSIRSSLSIFKLRSPITSKKDHALFAVYRHVRQLTRTVRVCDLPEACNSSVFMTYNVSFVRRLHDLYLLLITVNHGLSIDHDLMGLPTVD